MEDQRESIVTLTKHSINRIKQRVGIKNRCGQIGIAENAFLFGVSYDEAVGAERKYIESRMNDNPEYFGREVKLYRDVLFVFADNRLITVLPPDRTYCKKLEAQRRKKNHSCRVVA